MRFYGHLPANNHTTLGQPRKSSTALMAALPMDEDKVREHYVVRALVPRDSALHVPDYQLEACAAGLQLGQHGEVQLIAPRMAAVSALERMRSMLRTVTIRPVWCYSRSKHAMWE